MSPRLLGRRIMASSYAYYILGESVMPDEEFDQHCKQLLERWDEWDAPEKAYVTKEDLRAGTLYRLAEEDYPVRAALAAAVWVMDRRLSDGNL